MRSISFSSFLVSSSLARLGEPVERPSNIMRGFLFWVLVGILKLSLSVPFSEAAPIPIQRPSGIPEIPRACLSSDAEAYLDRHKWTEARDCYLDIIKRDTSSVTVWVGLATALTYLGRRQEALKHLNQAIDQVKSSQRGQLLTRIRVLSRLFLTNTAFQTYQDGLILLAGRKFKPSQEKFERAMSEEIDNVEVLLRMGQSTLLEGSSKEALAHFKMAKQLDPFDPEIRLWLGKTYQNRGNHRDALIELKEAYYSLKKELGKELGKDLGRNSGQDIERNLEAAAVWYADSLVSSRQTGAALRVLTQDSKLNTSHIYSLLAAAKLRTQANKSDVASWNQARKDLNQALKRLELANKLSDDSASSSQIQDNLAFVQDKTPEEIKAEIQGFLKQIDQFHPLRRS
ncbi:MAG: tetratricopeptide repeat protein [Bdellovibrionia bacterium]